MYKKHNIIPVTTLGSSVCTALIIVSIKNSLLSVAWIFEHPLSCDLNLSPFELNRQLK